MQSIFSHAVVCGVWCGQAALGLGLDGLPVANSTAGSRLWKWSGRMHADDAAHMTSSANDNAVTDTTRRDGINSSVCSLLLIYYF